MYFLTSLGRWDTAYIVRRVKALVVARPESVGFEPTAPAKGVTGFQDQLLKPLGQLSIIYN